MEILPQSHVAKGVFVDGIIPAIHSGLVERKVVEKPLAAVTYEYLSPRLGIPE